MINSLMRGHLVLGLSSAGSTGALERKKAGFVGAALKALQSTAAALPGVKTSNAIAAVLLLAKPKDSASASSQKVSGCRPVLRVECCVHNALLLTRKALQEEIEFRFDTACLLTQPSSSAVLFAG